MLLRAVACESRYADICRVVKLDQFLSNFISTKGVFIYHSKTLPESKERVNFTRVWWIQTKHNSIIGNSVQSWNYIHAYTPLTMFRKEGLNKDLLIKPTSATRKPPISEVAWR